MHKLLTSDVVLSLHEEVKEIIARELYDEYLLDAEMKYEVLGYYTAKDCKGDITYVVECMLGQDLIMSIELVPGKYK